MPPAQPTFPLKLEIELRGIAPGREVEIYVLRYARQLCADLNLPVSIAISLTASDASGPAPPGPFRITVNGQPSRDRWWPQPALPDQPSEQDIGALIGLALYDRREDFLTPELAAFLRDAWQVDGWSAEAFGRFLVHFARYNFSLRHAEAFIKRRTAGADCGSAAAYCFEQAIEEAAELTFGPVVYLSNDDYLYKDNQDEYAGRFKKAAEKTADELGFLAPAVRIEAGLLKPGEFQFQLNEVRLPVMRGLAHGEVLLIANADEIGALGAGFFRLFDPIAGIWGFAAEDSPEVTTRAKVWPGGPAGDLTGRLRLVLFNNAGSLLASPIAHLMLERLRQSAPNLVGSLPLKFPRLPPVHRWLTSVLRRLLDEQVSIRDLAAILEGLLNLREIAADDGVLHVYHFSELPDSPVRIASGSLADLCIEHLSSAARLGVRSLSVNPGTHEPVIMVALPGRLEEALAAQGGGVHYDEATQLAAFLTGQQTADELAVAVGQSVRGDVRESLRLEFPALRIFGINEASPVQLAEACHLAARSLATRRLYRDALELASRAALLMPEQPAYHYELGQIYDLLDRPEEANQQYQRAEDFASDPRWRTAVADVFFERKSFDSAIRIYRELAARSNQPEDHNRLGNRLYAIGAFRRAAEAYRAAAALAPKAAVYHANLGQALTAQANYLAGEARKAPLYNEAVREFEQAIEIDPAVAWYHQSLSWPLIQLARLDRAQAAPGIAGGLPAKAAEELRKAIDLDPKNAAARIELAQSLSRQEKFDEAVRELKTAMDAAPSVLEIQAALAKAYAQAGDYDEAVHLAEKINQAENPPADAVDLLTALRSAREAAGNAKQEPRNPVFAAELGHAQVRLGNLEAALALYRLAAGLAPSQPDAHKWLGNTLYKQGAYLAAASEWEQAGDDPLTINNLGTAYDALVRNEKAAALYERACALAPANFVPHYNLGSAHYRLRDWESARAAYSKSSECNPLFAPTHLNLGNCRFRGGQADEAASEWKESIRLDPKQIDARFNLGVVLWRRPDPESHQEATQQWREALTLDRNFTFAEDNLMANENGVEPALEIVDLLRPRE